MRENFASDSLPDLWTLSSLSFELFLLFLKITIHRQQSVPVWLMCFAVFCFNYSFAALLQSGDSCYVNFSNPVFTIGRSPPPSPSSCRMGLSEEFWSFDWSSAENPSFLRIQWFFSLKMQISDKQLLLCFISLSLTTGRIVCFPTPQYNLSRRGARLTLWRKDIKLNIELQSVHLSQHNSVCITPCLLLPLTKLMVRKGIGRLAKKDL